MHKTAAILNSRQALRPTGSESWITGACDAVKWAGEQGLSIFTSAGMQTWEMLIVISRELDVPQKIIVPVADASCFERECELITEQFGLEDAQKTFVCLTGARYATKPAELMRARDQFIIDSADILVPVCLRKGGNLDASIGRAVTEGKECENSFRAQTNRRNTALKYELAAEQISRELKSVGQRYITHWTRTQNGPWPFERKVDYYNAIRRSVVYPRQAFDSLAQIVNGRQIYASGRHMPNGNRCVCFSGLSPETFVPLMRWRTRYSEMSFEPYGIGIEKATAEDLEIRPVVYADSLTIHANSPEPPERWLRQSRGKIGDWEKEFEYRHRGDLQFKTVPREKLICFCYCGEQARFMTETTGIRTIPFFE